MTIDRRTLAMKHRKTMTIKTAKNIFYVGYDLWQWGIPFSWIKDEEFAELHFLCFFYTIS